MPQAKRIIEMILSDEKLKKSISSAVYRDEPIIQTASRMSSYVPEKIAELLRSFRRSDFYSLSEEKIFYKQAKLMEDYEDDYDYNGDFTCYYPTYRSMNTKQLRGYFSWRTNTRKGDIRKTSLSFAFVYIYELLHLVGVGSAEEGFERLSEFGKVYGGLDSRITPYVSRWLRDFAVYYDLDKALFGTVYDTSAEEALMTVYNYNKITDDELFNAVSVLSSYNILKSKLYKTYPEDCKKIVCAVYRTLCAYSDKRRKKSLFESYFGKPMSCPYEMFGTAVFYDSRKYKSFTYTVNDIHKYECADGKWCCIRFQTINKHSQKLGELVKTVDSIIRKKYGMSPEIIRPVGTKLTVGIIEKEIDAFLEEKKRNTPQKIDLDLSKLNDIRHSADITRDKLMTESETEETAEPPVCGKTAEAAPEGSSDNEIPLDENEYELLRCLLYGIGAETPVSRRGVMLSVVADSVNEKLFDMFGDNVIEFDGDNSDSPRIIEDYADELKGIVKK